MAKEQDFKHKIALYIDPYISPTSTFYTYILLKNAFERQYKCKMDIFIPYLEQERRSIVNDGCYVNERFAKQYNYEIMWNKIPHPKSYDGLIVIHIWNKKWQNEIDMRRNLYQLFAKFNKPVVCIKTDTTFEYRFVNKSIKYGLISNYKLKLNNKWLLPFSKIKSFQMSHLANLTFSKPDTLSRENFYKKYNLDPKKKIMIFFMARIRKWYRNEYFDGKTMIWFLKHIVKINKTVEALGYQLIYKQHKSDGYLMGKLFGLHRLPLIDHYDTHEAVIYADRSMSYGTTMVYELYMYNLPVLEIGHGVYYPGWLDDLKDSFKRYSRRELPDTKYEIEINRRLKPPFKEEVYDRGRNLIFGMITSYSELAKDYVNVFTKFINTDYDINDFRFRKNNPIHGNSHGSNVDEIATVLYENFGFK
jgi:hypothetical protein